MGRPCIDLSGQRFGMLTVMRRAYSGKAGAGYHAAWECICDCGKTTTVLSSSLRSGDTRSCGCISGNHKHGGRNLRLYSIWTNMKSRVNNPNASRYANYGGRGISICDEWLNSFENFRDWALSNGYADNLSIDRRDNDGNYEPSNCRWVDTKTQMGNTSVSLSLMHEGKIQTLNAWAREKEISASTLCRRLKKGMPLEQALVNL